MAPDLQGKRVAILAADVVDQDVVVDKNLITSRSPEDLLAFSEAIVSQLVGIATEEEENS